MNSDKLSLKEIAAIIDVSSSVLSNWQRRYSDFPEPSQIIGRRRRYRLADVKGFVARHGLSTAGGIEDKRNDKIVWRSASLLRNSGLSHHEVGFVITSIAYLWSRRKNNLKALAERGDIPRNFWPSVFSMEKFLVITNSHPDLIQKVAELWLDYKIASKTSPTDTERKAIVKDINGYLQSENDKGSGFLITFPSLAQLINKIGRGLEILDLTTGIGEILNTYEHEAHSLWGRDINAGAVELQLLLDLIRFGDPKRKLSAQDSLKDLEEKWLNSFDVVICEPPLNKNTRGVGPFTITDPRWTLYEQANIQSETDWWIQTVLAYLRPQSGESSNGPRGIIALGDSWLSGTSEQSMRTALLRRGHVEAVISLGTGIYSGTQIPINLLVLRKTDRPMSTVRLIDATAVGQVTRSIRKLSREDIAKIAGALNAKTPPELKKGLGRKSDGIVAIDATLDEIFENNAVLTPRRYRPAESLVQNPQSVLNEMKQVSKNLESLLETLTKSINSNSTEQKLGYVSSIKDPELKSIRLGEIQPDDKNLKIFFKNRQQGATWDPSDFVDGDILICLSGPKVGECMTALEFRESKPNWLRMLQIRIVDDQKLFKYFLFWLRYGDFLEQINRIAQGTTLRTVSKNDVGKILIPIPIPLMQENLGRLFDQIEAQKNFAKQISNLSEALDRKSENFLSAVFKKSMFVFYSDHPLNKPKAE